MYGIVVPGVSSVTFNRHKKLKSFGIRHFGRHFGSFKMCVQTIIRDFRSYLMTRQYTIQA